MVFLKALNCIFQDRKAGYKAVYKVQAAQADFFPSIVLIN